MPHTLVKNWFGDEFYQLAPQLQQLHSLGGTLKGPVEVLYGKGVAGIIGRRLAKKLNIPTARHHDFSVAISHHANGLHWHRVFNQTQEMKSVFTPVGNKTKGFWLEQTGRLHLKLTVDIIDGGWYWKILGYRFLGLPLPAWLLPKSIAYKFIDDDKYRFYVAFTAPILGMLFSYGGLLSVEK